MADYAQQHDPAREGAWIAEVDGERVGCVFCVGDNESKDDDRTARLRILLVHPRVRGQHLGRRLVDTCISFARDAGYTRLRLWTNDPLVAARHLYLEAGFVLVEEEPHHSFGVDLIGQTYELTMARDGTPLLS